jgi:hypothetical protein
VRLRVCANSNVCSPWTRSHSTTTCRRGNRWRTTMTTTPMHPARRNQSPRESGDDTTFCHGCCCTLGARSPHWKRLPCGPLPACPSPLFPLAAFILTVQLSASLAIRVTAISWSNTAFRRWRCSRAYAFTPTPLRQSLIPSVRPPSSSLPPLGRRHGVVPAIPAPVLPEANHSSPGTHAHPCSVLLPIPFPRVRERPA